MLTECEINDMKSIVNFLQFLTIKYGNNKYSNYLNDYLADVYHNGCVNEELDNERIKKMFVVRKFGDIKLFERFFTEKGLEQIKRGEDEEAKNIILQMHLDFF